MGLYQRSYPEIEDSDECIESIWKWLLIDDFSDENHGKWYTVGIVMCSVFIVLVILE